MSKYIYEGPVMEFDTLVSNKWRGETMATSERKARSNLAYQYKKKNNRLACTRVSLPGKIECVS